MELFTSIVGRRVLVTGAGTGIGASVAGLFGSFGALVGVHHRGSAAQAEKLCRDISSGPGKGKLFKADLNDVSSCIALIGDFVQEFGGIDILINNAGGIRDYCHFSELEKRSWDRTFSLNARAPFFLSREAFAHMKTARYGRIINISTAAVKYAGPMSLHYAASKAALETLTRGMAREGAAHNILVNTIRCGVIDTDMYKKINGYNEENLRKRVELIPLQRLGKPMDVARLALFLSSECGDFITGETYSVDGGD